MPRLMVVLRLVASHGLELLLGEVAAIEITLAAAGHKLQAMREAARRSNTVSLGIPRIRQSTGRSTEAASS